jgi:hypothetical protein
MVRAPISTKMLYKAKHTLKAFTTIKTTNAISPVITSISSPQQVYWSHATININNKYNILDGPPSSLMDSTMNPKVKTSKGKGIGVCSLACNTSGVEGCVGASGWRLGRLTSKSIIYTNQTNQTNQTTSWLLHS